MHRTTEGSFAMAPRIALVEDGPGSYRFTFATTRGEMSGRVTVGIEGPPDKRLACGLRQTGRTLRCPQGVVRLRHPAVQHYDLHGAVDPERTVVLCPVRARGHLGANSRQDRCIETQRALGRW